MTSDGNLFALMSTFVRILAAGSLSSAAKQLNTSQPTISRQLRTLETRLGVQLLNRSTHGMSLTGAGERYYEYAKGLIAELEAFEDGLRGEASTPTGTLRVVVPTAFGQDWFVEMAARYFEVCPAVRLEWRLTEAVVNFSEEAVDCVVRVGLPKEEGTVARHLGEVRRLIVATSSFLARHADIIHPEDLSSLPWIALSTYYLNGVDLRDRNGNSRQVHIAPRFVADHVLATRKAALLGLGLVLISEWAVRGDLADGTLVRVLPEWFGTSVPVYLIYPRSRFYPVKLRRFLEIADATVPGYLEQVQASIKGARPNP